MFGLVFPKDILCCFHPFSSFDVAVKKSRPDDKFVYITIRRKLAELEGFKVLISHPLSREDCKLYDYREGISRIDWDSLETVGADDAYSKNVKMAECLSNKPIPIACIHCIYVPDERTKEYIKQLFEDKGITKQSPYINVMAYFL